MSRTLQFKRYANTVVATTTGASGELIIDNTNNTLTVHDGSTVGGTRLATENWVKANEASIVYGQAAFNAANSAAANTVYQTGVNLTQNTSIQAAFNTANNALANTNGAVFNGNLTITGTANVGLLNSGTLTYAAAGLFATLQGNTNSYQQVVLQNSNTGTQASADYIVSNAYSTDGFLYGDFGMNSPTFSGPGALSAANNIYLYASNADLAIGTVTANAIHFVVNNNAVDAMSISSGGTVSVPGSLFVGQGVGYAIGSGGTVTQATNRTTGVTLNKPTGQITLFSQAMANTTSNTFVFTNSSISPNDLLLINHWSGGTLGNYTFASNTSTGQANVTIRAINTVTAEAPVLQFMIIKGAIA